MKDCHNACAYVGIGSATRSSAGGMVETDRGVSLESASSEADGPTPLEHALVFSRDAM